MLEIQHLTKTYKNSEKHSVYDLSLKLNEGEIFGFLGKNGAGKSTTIKCLTGIQPYDSGVIKICGFDVQKQPISAKMHLGYVPDDHSVIDKLTGREYVNYIADLYRVSKDDRSIRLNKFLELFNLGFAVDRQIKSYSHGMKQKICIIAALIHNPELWVLDEPMMGLDPQSMADIIFYMQEHARQGNTVFFSSHNLDIVKKLCHRVGIINDGKLIDILELCGNEENQEKLEGIFFQAAGLTNTHIIEPTKPLNLGEKHA